MELKIVNMKIPEGANLVLGQSHFIKTAEDIYEVMAGGVPGAKFAVAFLRYYASEYRLTGGTEQIQKRSG